MSTFIEAFLQLDGQVISSPILSAYRPYCPYWISQNTTKCSLCLLRHQDHLLSERSMSKSNSSGL